MGNFESMNIPHTPEKEPVAMAPVFDEQKESDKMLLQEYRELLEKEEDPVAQYILIGMIVDLETKEYYENGPDEKEKITDTSESQIGNKEYERVDPWLDLGYHKGFENREFPHPTKSTKTTAEKEAAKKIAIEKALKKRRERDGHIGYIDPQDPTL